MSIRCPKCRLHNPESAKRCDCGYDFSTKNIEQSYLTPKQTESSRAPSTGQMLFCLLLPFFGFFYALVLVAKGEPKGKRLIAISVMAFLVGALIKIGVALLRR